MSPLLTGLLGGMAGNYFAPHLFGQKEDEEGLIGQQQQPQGLLKSGSFFNPNTREGNLRLAQSFNSMRTNSDANLATSMENELSTIGETATSTDQRNRTIEYLKAQGKPELIALLNAGMSVEDVLKHAKPTYTNDVSSKAYEPRFDSKGKEYIPVFNPNTNTVERVYTGTTGLTFKEKQEKELEQKQKKQDIENKQAGINRATKAGQTAWDATLPLENQIFSLESARDLLTNNNVETGLVPKFLAEKGIFLDAENSGFMGELLALQNQLGIDVINSATFGALSEREMAMAMRTNLNLALPSAELVKMIDQRIAARRKLLIALRRQAEGLTTGQKTYNEYIQEQVAIKKERNNYRLGNIKAKVGAEMYNQLEDKAKSIIDPYTGKAFVSLKAWWQSLTFEQQKRYVTL